MRTHPPAAPQRPKALTTNGDVRVDPWFWLREVDDPAVTEYLKAENAYTAAVMWPTDALQNDLYEEMRERIKEDDSTVPEKEGDYYYYVRFAEGAQYPIHCRKHLTLDAPEEIILDVNELAEGQDYLQVGVLKNSPDHQWLAYSLDTDGSEKFVIHFKNLVTGELLPETIPNSYYSLEWANDSRTVFYDVLDENHRPVKILHHRLGQDPATDKLVYRETDERFFVDLGKSLSKRFIYVVASGNNMSEWRFLDANRLDGQLTLIEPRRPDFEYAVVDHGDRFLVRHNGDGAKDFKVAETPVSAPGKANWQDFIPHEPGRPVLSVLSFQDHLAITYRRKGLPQLQVMTLPGKEVHTVPFDEEDYSLRVRSGREWATTVLRFTYASLTTPPLCTTTTWRRERGSLRSGPRCRVVFSPITTGPAACGPPPATGPLYPSPSSTGRTHRWTDRRPYISTAMAPTARSWNRILAPTASAWWIGALSSPWPTFVVAWNWAGTGTSRASCCTRRIRSPTSSPAPSIWRGRGTSRPGRWWRWGAALAACSWEPWRTCGPTYSEP